MNSFNPNGFNITAYAPTSVGNGDNRMLIFSQGNGNQAISIGGSGGTFNGYMYAPSTGAVIGLAGSGTNSLKGALYGDNVNINGGGWTLTGTGPVPTGIFISGLTE